MEAGNRNCSKFLFQRHEGKRESRGSSDLLEGKALKGETPGTDQGERPLGGRSGDQGVERVEKP